MNYHKFNLILLTMALLSCQNPKKVTEGKDLGPHALDILKGLEEIPESDFLKNFITLDEIRGLELDAIERNHAPWNFVNNQINSLNSGRWFYHDAYNLETLRTKGQEFGIVWQDLEFLDYRYELLNRIGEGMLLFQHNNVEYIVHLFVIFDGEQYRIYLYQHSGSISHRQSRFSFFRS